MNSNILLEKLNEHNTPFLNINQLKLWNNVRGWLPYSAGKVLNAAASLSLLNYGKHVEIGSYSGRSTICIASALTKTYPEESLTAIDIAFQPDFDSNIKLFELSNYVKKIQGKSIDIAEKWEYPISFLFIDADHSEAACLADLFSWDNHIIKNGILALDDTAGAFYLGPALAESIILSSHAYEAIISSGGVSIFQKKGNIQNPTDNYILKILRQHVYIRHASSVSGALDINLVAPKSSSENMAKVIMRLKNASILIKMIENSFYEELYYTILYLQAIIEFQLGNVEISLEILNKVKVLNNCKFIHYNLPIQPFIFLRLGQIYDLLGSRKEAIVNYKKAADYKNLNVIQSASKSFITKKFTLKSSQNYNLLRDYHLFSKFSKSEILLPKINKK
ncbi:MAG: class I SAM-dependent methyltransferase [Candidatus Delongbacteria bacterium]|nr:class I SAM-dependent methyltransferase [Candidatus Delongbacteria bacterium]